MKIKVCIIDMNNGLENQAMRAFREIVKDFHDWVEQQNPECKVICEEISIRDNPHPVIPYAEIYLSTGGPGSPWDGEGSLWEKEYFKLLDSVAKNPEQSILAICHSYQLLARWSARGEVRLRPQGKKFGIMPVYMTDLGQKSQLLGSFGDRLFSFEHRDWEVVNYQGPGILARESRDGISKGEAIMAMDFDNNMQGVQFHPEADPKGILSWLLKPEKKQEVIDTYGEELWETMIRTLNREDRVINTRKLLIPQWLHKQYDRLKPI